MKKCLMMGILWMTAAQVFAQNEKTIDSLLMDQISLEEVSVAALRAQKDQPVSFSELTKAQIKSRNLGQDLPVLMNFLPSVVTTSDAGAGIGYTGIRVRGSDATRVNVTINGIPYNDAESQGTFWVNLPDFASSVESIQLQRGVGTSTNGVGAFGASINIATDRLFDQGFAQFSTAMGSFGTRRNTLKFSTGLLNDRIAFSGRLAKITSDGYVDRASSNLKSYFLQAAYRDDNTLIKALAFGGHEITYQSWFGVDPVTLTSDRTYNFAGEMYSDQGTLEGYFDNQVDNYQQDHFQFHWNQRYSPQLTSSVGLNYTHGRGYYEEFNDAWYDQNIGFSGMSALSNLGLAPVGVTTNTDNITRKWLDNDFYVMTADLQYNTAQTQAVIGALVSRYDGDHFGRLIWARFASTAAPDHEFYRNKGEKSEQSVFGKITHKLTPSLTGFLDLQYRRVQYTANGSLNGLGQIAIDDTFGFFNPKAGFTYQQNESTQWYFSYAKASREPNRTDYENGSPRPEVLNDFEAGIRKENTQLNWTANLYYMRYKDQLVLTGAIDEVGAPLRENIGDSYRMGVELTASWALNSQWLWQPNLTLSQNRNLDYKFQRDGQVQDLGNTSIAFSPNAIAGSRWVYQPNNQWSFGLLSKYVGEQFMGNIDADLSVLPDYHTHDLNISMNISSVSWAKEIRVDLLINNLFDEQYISNGYFYTYDDSWSTPNQVTTIEGVGYYPQAGRNFLLGATIAF